MNRFKHKNLLLVPLSLVIMLFVDSCVKHDLEPPIVIDCTGFETVSFATDIQPILSSHCAISGCHNGDNGPDKNWTDPVKFKNHASEAKRRVVLPKTNGDHMPREGSITNDQIKLIVCWVEQGAPINN